MLSNIPTWLWVVGTIVLVFIVFGERILWGYEVKFPFKEGIGRGKVQLKYGKKRGTRIKCVFELDPAWQNIPIDIYLRENLIYTVPAEKNKSSRFFLQQTLPLDKPREGDPVVVKANDNEIFSGPLVLD